ncbi:MAG: hypothetical protein JWO86_6107 [Myxococcaceae bacterium]|jgi:hypothetical protein|nr:hypothetical protein [Myxococcaceae bacterium]MEA2749530.1 hypothetical protein [Myxococcales bacterium]
MKRLLWLFFAFAALSCKRAPDADRGLVGAWRLAALEEPGADGTVRPMDASGLLVVTRDGRMSVQVMYRGSPTRTDAGRAPYAQDGYEASFGRYQLDESDDHFTYHVEGALVRTLIGKDLPRLYQLSGKKLIIKSAIPTEHWRVTWEHD